MVLSGGEPSSDEPTTVDRTASERLATAAERASVVSRLDRLEGEETTEADVADDAADAAEGADKTDMSAVGDDGQVFGG